MKGLPRWPSLTFAAAAVLMLGGIGLAFYADRTFQAQRQQAFIAQARVLAATVTAALAFNDRQAAQEYAAALRANPDIRFVGIYDQHGTMFASYPPGPVVKLPAPLGTEGVLDDSGALDVVVPVLQQGVLEGGVMLRAQREPLILRVERYGVIGLLVAMAALLIAVLSNASAALSRANTALQQRARDLAGALASLRAEIENREKAEAALRQAQKMDAIGQLTGGVAHDFNNLLQIILGSLDRLRVRVERGEGTIDELGHLLQGATGGAQRAATLTQRLLAFARRQPLDPKPVDVNKLVGGMSDLLRRTLGETIQTETVLAGGLWRVFADENQLENALLNLAVNARDAMPQGGKLTVETANAYLDDAYGREEGVKPGQYVMIAVTDTGMGMTPEVRAQVFEPFFTTKGAGHGTGLGLSQVYGFIKQSDGHVKIYSEVGEGTTVKLYLPRLTGDEAVVAGASMVAVPAGSALEIILVVEDEPNVREITTEMLRDLGYAVLAASDGPSALAVLDAVPQIRLLFTDIGLPGPLNGRQLADEARRRRPALLVLYTTGYARNAIVHQGRLDPGVELIGKPFSTADLARRVRALLDG